ncbi:MAG: hypothetical protein J6V38_05830 [Kiritimatiellae bacterium]|nr:hypothetical protein [Kiritimatiellia bacterium]
MRHIKMFRAALAALVTVVFTSQLQAADIFVSPTGNGEKTGANWSNALNGSNDGWHIDVKNAITSAVASEAEEVNVYLAAGDYSITNELALSSITIPVKFSGGYVGEADGSLEESEELITKFTNKGPKPTSNSDHSKKSTRFLSASSLSALTVEKIDFMSGYVAYSSARAGGIVLSSSNTFISKCLFSGCHARGKSNTSAYGGAIYVANGSLVVEDCDFNSNYSHSAGLNCRASGGAICSLNAKLMVKRSNFVGNYVHGANTVTSGGAINANGKDVVISNCTFTKNYAVTTTKNSGHMANGGALSIRSATHFEMSDSILDMNYSANNHTYAQIAGYYFDDFNPNDGVMTAAVTRCVFDSKSLPSSDYKTKSDILLNGGCLFMTNCIISQASGTHSAMTNSFRVERCMVELSSLTDLVATSKKTPISTCSAELVNCTIADGKGAGAVRIGTDCDMVLKNCIVSGNTAAGAINATSIEHSYIQKNVDDGSWNYEGEGNLNPDVVGDINWTGYPYYHLLTKKADGAITNGWFSGTFESPKCAADSPCIDAGAPGSPGLNLEPYYSGRRVNIGAYGGTPWASKTSPLPGFKLIVR